MSDRANAANTVLGLVVGGLLAICLGTFVAVVEWPTESTYGDESGSALVAYLGLGVAGVGQVALFAAIVAWAVTVGIRWSGLPGEVDAVRRATSPDGGSRFSGVTPLGPVDDEDGR